MKAKLTLTVAPLAGDQMSEFVRARGRDQPERRIALAHGSPPALWLQFAESAPSRQDKLEDLPRILYLLLEDLLLWRFSGAPVCNAHLRPRLSTNWPTWSAATS